MKELKDWLKFILVVLAVFFFALVGKGLAKIGDDVGLSAPWWAWAILVGVTFTGAWVSSQIQHVSGQVESVGESIRRS